MHLTSTEGFEDSFFEKLFISSQTVETQIPRVYFKINSLENLFSNLGSPKWGERKPSTMKVTDVYDIERNLPSCSNDQLYSELYCTLITLGWYDVLSSDSLVTDDLTIIDSVLSKKDPSTSSGEFMSYCQNKQMQITQDESIENINNINFKQDPAVIKAFLRKNIIDLAKDGIFVPKDYVCRQIINNGIPEYAKLMIQYLYEDLDKFFAHAMFHYNSLSDNTGINLIFEKKIEKEIKNDGEKKKNKSNKLTPYRDFNNRFPKNQQLDWKLSYIIPEALNLFLYFALQNKMHITRVDIQDALKDAYNPKLDFDSSAKQEHDAFLHKLQTSCKFKAFSVLQTLNRIGFKNHGDYIFYYENVSVILHVDVLLVTYKDEESLDNFLQKINHHFTFSKPEPVKNTFEANRVDFFGIQIEYCKGMEMEIHIDIASLLEDFKPTPCEVPPETPLTPGVEFFNETANNLSGEIFKKRRKYLQKLTSITNYLASIYRFDICYASNILTRYQSKPSDLVMAEAQHLINYLHYTASKVLNWKYKKRSLNYLNFHISGIDGPVNQYATTICFNKEIIYAWSRNTSLKCYSCNASEISGLYHAVPLIDYMSLTTYHLKESYMGNASYSCTMCFVNDGLTISNIENSGPGKSHYHDCNFRASFVKSHIKGLHCSLEYRDCYSRLLTKSVSQDVFRELIPLFLKNPFVYTYLREKKLVDYI